MIAYCCVDFCLPLFRGRAHSSCCHSNDDNYIFVEAAAAALVTPRPKS